MKRAFIFLEDGDWQSADEYCEKVLDLDPQNATAYLGKLMAELHVKRQEYLRNCKQPFDGSGNYKKVMRYGSEALQKEITDYNSALLCRKATERMKSAKTIKEYEEVKQLLIPICTFKDAVTLIAKCDEAISSIVEAEKEETYQMAAAIKKSAKTIKEYEDVKQLLITIRAYKDAEVLIAKCDETISAIKAKKEAQKEEIYQKASAMAASGDYYNAVLTYGSILQYKDSCEQIKKCAESSRVQSEQQKERINSLKKQQENIQAELTALENKIATLKKQQLQMASCKDSLRKSREDQRKLAQQREAFAVELSGLGVFAFSRKKQLQASINDCDAQLAVLSKNISALENGTDYDAVIQQIQTEIEEMKKSCSDLKQKIENMQKNIDAAQALAENTTGDFEILEFGVRMNSVLALTMEAFMTDLKKATNFINSSKISELIIPDSVTSIGEGAFYGCKSLTSVTIPDSVTSIEGAAFKDCIGLADDKGFVIIRNVLCSYCGNDGAVTIPDSVTSIGEWAFKGCTSLTSLTIPDSVTSIGGAAFYGCKSLTSVTIPDSVTSIGNYAFFSCESLTSLTIPDSVTSIARSAFFGCKKLTIKCKKGSYAESYAKINNIPFREI